MLRDSFGFDRLALDDTVQVRKFRASAPVDSRWMRRGYFQCVLRTSFIHPTDSRFMCEYVAVLDIGSLRQSAGGRASGRFNIVEIQMEIEPRLDTEAAQIIWFYANQNRLPRHERLLREAFQLRAVAQYGDWWDNLYSRTVDLLLNLLEPPAYADHPAVEYGKMCELARGVFDRKTKTPPAVLLDWLRESSPVVEKMFSTPPLPRLAALYPYVSN